MKKSVSLVLALLIALCMMGTAMAEAPAAGSLNPVPQDVRGNVSFTEESFNQIWITPIYDDHIIGKTDLEKYPPKFISFPAIEGTALMDMRYDQCTMVNHDDLTLYYYVAYDRYSFEVFLEKAEEENIISDGSDGELAMYVQPDNGRCRALISLKQQFGGTAKMEIIIDSYDRNTKADVLKEMIQAEAARVMAAMQLVELDHYWSEGVFGTVQLLASRDSIVVTINTEGLTVTRLEPDKLIFKAFVSERNASGTEITLENYSYPYSKAEDGDEAATDETLADGTTYKCYTSDYSSHASFTVLEEDSRGNPLYLNIKIDCEPDAFKSALEKTYALIQVSNP